MVNVSVYLEAFCSSTAASSRYSTVVERLVVEKYILYLCKSWVCLGCYCSVLRRVVRGVGSRIKNIKYHRHGTDDVAGLSGPKNG